MNRDKEFERCTGCGCWKRDCQPLWREHKKCCPDCSHVPTYPMNLKPWELEPHYSLHVSAMTAEGLHDKCEIAAQLAWRDQQIERLTAELNNGLNELEELLLGLENCVVSPRPEIFVRLLFEREERQRLFIESRLPIAAGDLLLSRPRHPFTRPLASVFPKLELHFVDHPRKAELCERAPCDGWFITVGERWICWKCLRPLVDDEFEVAEQLTRDR